MKDHPIGTVSLFGQWLVRLRLGHWNQAFWITFNVSLRAARPSYGTFKIRESHRCRRDGGRNEGIVDGAWTGLALMKVKRNSVMGKKGGESWWS